MGLEANGTRERILQIALQEFSAKGLAGARVDDIAALTQTSKRMIYYHFASKEELYRAVIERAYAGIRETEAHEDIDSLPAEDALATIVGTSFDYHCRNEAFVRLVMNENIHHAEHIKQLRGLGPANRRIIDILGRIVAKGVQEGVFRDDVDVLQLHMTICALAFHFVSNRYTFSHVFEYDMGSPHAAADRRTVAVATVVGWCRATASVTNDSKPPVRPSR